MTRTWSKTGRQLNSEGFLCSPIKKVMFVRQVIYKSFHQSEILKQYVCVRYSFIKIFEPSMWYKQQYFANQYLHHIWPQEVETSLSGLLTVSVLDCWLSYRVEERSPCQECLISSRVYWVHIALWCFKHSARADALWGAEKRPHHFQLAKSLGL